MGSFARAVAAALAFVGLATGCARTTEGSVAMTTEPGPPLASPRTPSTIDPGFPGLPGLPGLPNIPGLPQIPGLPNPSNSNVPEVPAPANWETMKCSEYTKLDEATQRAVIKAIVEDQGSQQGRGPESEMIAAIMATTMCGFLPSAVVKEVVAGGSPP